VLLLGLDAGGEGEELGRVGVITRAREGTVLLAEGVKRLKAEVELEGAVKLGKVRDEELSGVGEGLLEGFLFFFCFGKGASKKRGREKKEEKGES